MESSSATSNRNGDTLEWDAFGDTQFDAVVANPPFSAEWSAADKFNNDDRFSKAGRLAPKKQPITPLSCT